MAKPKRSIDLVLWDCFEHFVHLDYSNAAIHCASVRFSPITFRLAEHLSEIESLGRLAPANEALLGEVLHHLNKYEEDKGR